ncbi:MAG TPA: ABC transporter permease subunit [Gemmataceae bacterium]|jgi:ABC-2 type transport system permease protein|nr:ABC transporter permease subunit [Gemmataceae bacterium]
MTFVLYRKLLRDVRVPLAAVSALLCLFAGLWVKVTVQVTTQIAPLLSLAGSLGKFGPTFFMDLFFNGPGKLIQTFLGGESVRFEDAQDTLAVVGTHPLVQAIVCIWAIGRGAGAIAGEIDRGTMELLLAQPVARGKVILAHFLVDLTVIPILCLALTAGIHIGVYIVGDFTVDPGVYEAVHMKPPNPLPTFKVNPNVVHPGMLNTAALLFAVSGFTMWLSAAGRSRTRVLGLAILVTLVQFLVNVIGQLWDGLRMLRPLTVFYYYQPQAINMRNNWLVDPGRVWTGHPTMTVNVVWVLVVVGAIGYLMAWRTFAKRDVPAPL